MSFPLALGKQLGRQIKQAVQTRTNLYDAFYPVHEHGYAFCHSSQSIYKISKHEASVQYLCSQHTSTSLPESENRIAEIDHISM